METAIQDRRLAGMILWLRENPRWAQLICGMEEAPLPALLELMEALREKEYYEFLLVLLEKNRNVRSVGRAIERLLSRHMTAASKDWGIAAEILTLETLLREEGAVE